MDYMFEVGFLGTRAPLFMDVVTLIVALLPFLVAGAIYLAKIKKYKLHSYAQIFIFAFSVIVIFYFELGVRVGGGFNTFMDGSAVAHNYAFFVLILHIAIAVITLVLWFVTLIKAKKFLSQGIHKKMGKITFLGIILTTLSSMWVYLLLFVF